ncbi:MAG TPA: MFS transporter [Nitriliruptoraceae bacterium]|nr:MFS transporter [Nitriliruptoraceae bacterium]
MTTSTATVAPTSIFDPRFRGATLAILLVVALSAFEGLAVAAALPQVVADVGGVSLLPWVITSYLLTSGVATIAAGALVDRVGVSAVFRVAVIVFTVGGVLAGFAPTMPLLVAARVLQGIGAGATNAVGLSAVGLVFPRHLVGRAFAANTTVWGVMGVAGPAIAAGLLAVASWRWVFLVNLPLGLVALAVGWRALPGRRSDDVGSARLNPLNLALLTAFTFLSLLAVDMLDWRSIPASVGALACGAWVLQRNRGRADALVAPRHTVMQPLGPLAWAIALLLIGAIGAQSFVPLLVSGARGAGTALTAWSVLFFVIGWTTGANVASRLIDRYTPLTVTMWAAVLVPSALVGVGVAVGASLTLVVVFAFLFVAGSGMGATTNSGLTLLQTLVPANELGRATAAHQYIRNQGFAVGNALVGAVLLLVVGRATGDVEMVRDVLAAGGVDGGGEGVAAGGDVAAAIQSGFATATLVGAGVAALAVVPLLALRRWLTDNDGPGVVELDRGGPHTAEPDRGGPHA